LYVGLVIAIKGVNRSLKDVEKFSEAAEVEVGGYAPSALLSSFPVPKLPV